MVPFGLRPPAPAGTACPSSHAEHAILGNIRRSARLSRVYKDQLWAPPPRPRRFADSKSRCSCTWAISIARPRPARVSVEEPDGFAVAEDALWAAHGEGSPLRATLEVSEECLARAREHFTDRDRGADFHHRIPDLCEQICEGVGRKPHASIWHRRQRATLGPVRGSR